MIEQVSDPAIIDPFLNGAYWQREIGDGTAVPWPNQQQPGMMESAYVLNFLTKYIERGASRLALSRLGSGDVFDANNFSPGTIILTLAESVNQDSDQPTPMSHFADLPLPEGRPGLADNERDLDGYGYNYGTKQWINIITGNQGGVCVIGADKISGNEIDKKELSKVIARYLSAGVRKYTVGETYNFKDANNCETLVRVNELIVCMHGLDPKGRFIPKDNTVPGQLAAEGGFTS